MKLDLSFRVPCQFGLRVLAVASCLAVASVASAQTATIRQNGNTSSVVVSLPGLPASDPATVQVRVLRTDLRPSIEVANTSVKPAGSPDGKTTTLEAPLILESPIDPRATFEVSLSSGGITWVRDLKISRRITARFSTVSGTCVGGLAVSFDTAEGADITAMEWEGALAYLFPESRGDSTPLRNDSVARLVAMRIFSDGKESAFDVDAITSASTPFNANLTGGIGLCLKPRYNLPSGEFSAELIFRNAPPILNQAFVGDRIAGSGSVAITNAAAVPGGVGSRPLERNLDLGLSFTSSIDPASSERINRGAMDVRLAPLLEIALTKAPPSDQRWFPLWTPIYLDANVATGPITKDTVALNRVELGTALEYRFIPFEKRQPGVASSETDTGPFSDVYRFIVRAKHVSDRDFKQKEFLVSFEFSPLPSFFVRPRSANWSLAADTITARSVIVLPATGYEFRPVVGVTIGRTYALRDPAPGDHPGPTVRRLHAGFEFTFDVFDRLRLLLAETIYVRGEVDSDRVRSHFKAEADVPLGSPANQTQHGLFIRYERGNAPPFAGPDADSLRVGYRIRSDGWFGFGR